MITTNIEWENFDLIIYILPRGAPETYDYEILLRRIQNVRLN